MNEKVMEQGGLFFILKSMFSTEWVEFRANSADVSYVSSIGFDVFHSTESPFCLIDSCRCLIDSCRFWCEMNWGGRDSAHGLCQHRQILQVFVGLHRAKLRSGFWEDTEGTTWKIWYQIMSFFNINPWTVSIAYKSYQVSVEAINIELLCCKDPVLDVVGIYI
jgi:hypothetical protein